VKFLKNLEKGLAFTMFLPHAVIHSVLNTCAF